MGVIDLQQRREERTPHLRGTAKCLACAHQHESVSPEGVIAGMECPACGAFKCVLMGLVSPDTRFVCNCGNDLYHILPDGCQCANCGVLAKGF